jgi:hypothetical protein
MILAQSLATARAQRTQRVLPDGRTIWVSQVFPASDETPEMPMASFVEQLAHTTIPSHFHAVNQFQVVVEGEGTLGKRAVYPWTVHYTNGFTGYGPLCAGAAGMAFFTLRNRWDAGGARYFPAGQSFMQPAPKLHHLVGPLLLSNEAALHSRQYATCDLVLTQEDDGLAAWCLRLGPTMRTHAPDPADGGGQYLLVVGGTLWHDGAMLPRLSCLYVSADTGPFVLQSGTEGLEALLLQFPVAEASAVQPGGMSRTHRPDADLRAASLVRAHLTRARLPWARLLRAHLHGAYLHGAYLQEANLQRAYLVGTDLSGADLCGAYLEWADLQWANLQETILRGAHLQEANLHESVLGSTIFGHTHLHGARGLATCRHQAPSFLDVGTCPCSGSLPVDFLRGCGWSDAEIAGLVGRLQEPPVSTCIERSLALPIAYQQAGLSLLTSVSSALRQQHPDIPIHCRLVPSWPMVRLLVDTPVGARETVEQTLQAYSGVMAERQPPTAWRVDPVQEHHLRQHLEGAATVLRLTYDVPLQSGPPDVTLPLTVAERLRHLRQLVGSAMYDL